MALRAIVVGSTGLVGKELVGLLLEDPRFDRIVSLVRRASGRAHDELEEHVVDFHDAESWAPLVEGDVLFSTLGTTLKAAGSKDAQYEIDYTLQYRVAEAAAKARVATYVLVSSIGASPGAWMFYSRMKGELERDVQKLGFERLRILRPGLLTGRREVPRAGERIGEALLSALGWMPGVGGLRPISARVVASAMGALALDPAPGTRIAEGRELFELRAPAAS
jgi:uncharacterized protein YbjT (DUF2867 family)